MCVLTEEANEGLEQVGFRAFGDGACALHPLRIYLPDDRAGRILRAGHEVLVRCLVLQVDHGCQSLMREIMLHQHILRLVRLLAWTGQQLVQGVSDREAMKAVRANCGISQWIDRKQDMAEPTGPAVYFTASAMASTVSGYCAASWS